MAALQPLFEPAFTLFSSPVTWLEVVAFVLAIWMVVCNIKVNPTGWPLAIVSSLLYFALFWQNRLYGDASLQLLFVVVAGWGWWQWMRGTAADGVGALKVRHMPLAGRLGAVAAMVFMWPLLGVFLDTATDTDVPYFDAFPTAGSVIGQFLLGRKYVENWPAWVLVNVVSVGLYAYKGLWLTALLYLIFVAMSFAGWSAWRRLAAVRGPAAADAGQAKAAA